MAAHTVSIRGVLRSSTLTPLSTGFPNEVTVAPSDSVKLSTTLVGSIDPLGTPIRQSWLTGLTTTSCSKPLFLLFSRVRESKSHSRARSSL